MTDPTQPAADGKLRPADKNRYFSGKLLTSRDCKDEQDFHNEKRRLINRLTLGDGVVCGLRAKQSPAQASSLIFGLTHGLALDALGREIVVAEDRRST